MKIYGADICIDCRNLKHIMKSRGMELDYRDITADELKQFMLENLLRSSLGLES